MNFAPYLTYSGMGFSQLKNQPLAALAPADYERMFDSKEDWDTLQQQMDSYFDSKIDMFEYRLDDKATPKRSTLHSAVDRLFFRVEHPNRYFELEDDLIRRRFPGGMGNGAG